MDRQVHAMNNKRRIKCKRKTTIKYFVYVVDMRR